MIWLLVATALLIVCSACFSGFENGMLAIRQPRLNHALENNSQAARLIKRFLDRPSYMLATILLGNNLVNSFSAIFFTTLMERLHDAAWVGVLGSAVLTVIVLIFGEITPKVWFRQKPFVRCSVMVYPMTVFYWVSYPLVRGLTGFVFLLNRLLPKGAGTVAEVSPALMREDFRMMLLESEEQRLIDPEARALLDNALDYHNAHVSDRMVPRAQVAVAYTDMNMTQLVALAERTGVSRFPVARSQAPDATWIGTITVYDAYFRVPRERWSEESLLDWVRPALTIRGDAPVSQVLVRARTGTPILIVRGDDGSQVGIVTPADVVTPLIGTLRM